MKNIIKRPITHELNNQKPIIVVIRIVGEAYQIDKTRTLNLRQDLDLVVDLVGDDLMAAGSFDGEMAAAEDGLVDGAVAALAEKLLVGEAIGGGFEVAVDEMLDLDGV